MAYIKAIKGNDVLDQRLSEKMKRKRITITQADIDFMNTVLQKKKNGEYYSDDKGLLFALLCHYKYAEQNGKLKEGWLYITRKKHTVANSRHKKRVPFVYNMNTIMNMVGAQSYSNSFKRFIQSGFVHIVKDKAIQLKMDIFHADNNKEVFVVEDIYNPYVYLLAYEQGRELKKCIVCGNHFIKRSNNQKTCCFECSCELQKFNVEKNNERRRIKALQERKKVI